MINLMISQVQMHHSHNLKRTNSLSGSGNKSSTNLSSLSSNTNTNYESHNGLVHDIKLDRIEESKLIKLYIMLLLIRIKIFGVNWDFGII